MEFIELRASKLGVPYLLRADFEVCSVLAEMARAPIQAHVGRGDDHGASTDGRRLAASLREQSDVDA